MFIGMADPKVSFVFMPTPSSTIADHKWLQYLPKRAFTSCLSCRKQTSIQETCQSPSSVFSWMKESRSRMSSAFSITWLVNYMQLLTHPFTRRKLKATVAEHKEAPLESLEKEIHTHHTKLHVQIAKWCGDQKVIMPKVVDHILCEKICNVEDEELCLPSGLDADTCLKVEAMELGVKEGKLREGAAFDALHATQIAVKTLKTLQDEKAKNA